MQVGLRFVFKEETPARMRFSSENEVSTRIVKNLLNNFPKFVESLLFAGLLKEMMKISGEYEACCLYSAWANKYSGALYIQSLLPSW